MVFGIILIGIFLVSCSTAPKACTMDAKVCPDGSAVGRDGDNNCEFFPCPKVSSEKPKLIACTMEAKLCPDGSSVGRNPDNNCEFDPCPG